MEALITIVENIFRDPNRVSTAEGNLQGPGQKNRNFSDYLTDFQRYMAEAVWNDIAKRTVFYEGLRSKIKDTLITLDMPDELDQ